MILFQIIRLIDLLIIQSEYQNIKIYEIALIKKLDYQ